MSHGATDGRLGTPLISNIKHTESILQTSRPTDNPSITNGNCVHLYDWPLMYSCRRQFIVDGSQQQLRLLALHLLDFRLAFRRLCGGGAGALPREALPIKGLDERLQDRHLLFAHVSVEELERRLRGREDLKGHQYRIGSGNNQTSSIIDQWPVNERNRIRLWHRWRSKFSSLVHRNIFE